MTRFLGDWNTSNSTESESIFYYNMTRFLGDWNQKDASRDSGSLAYYNMTRFLGDWNEVNKGISPKTLSITIWPDF